MTTPTKPRIVELYCCDRCGGVGKILTTYGGKSSCVGPKGHLHPRTRMVPVRFEEIVEENDA